MLISRLHKFLFIAVPKTATSSIEQALQKYGDSQGIPGLGKHALAMELPSMLQQDELASLFTFGFVRDPYSWMYSWYRYRQRDQLSNPSHRHHNRYAGNKSFDEFMLSYNEGQIFMKQSDFLYSHSGEKLVDFVGRYETLQDDFDAICQRLNLPCVQLPSINVSHNKSSRADAINSRSRAIINDHFKRDFELFGYPMKD